MLSLLYGHLGQSLAYKKSHLSQSDPWCSELLTLVNTEPVKQKL